MTRIVYGIDSLARSGRHLKGVGFVSPCARGFTLIELIVTMIVIGILAVTVVPRFADRAAFDERGFYDGTLSILHYAQKSAVAQRRQVCVAFGAVPASVTLTVAANFGGACDTDLAGPNGAAPYTLIAPVGVTFSPVPANFSFLPSGAVSAGPVISVTQNPGKIITVDAVTGNVYSN